MGARVLRKPPPLYAHQKQSIRFFHRRPRVFDTSDPGTGKTRAHLEAWARRRRKGGGCLLVLAPKSILQSAWGNDIDTFLPGFTYAIATNESRGDAFALDADIYLTNTDAVKWLAQQKKAFFKKFDSLIVDESTFFKHRTSQRSKALNRIKGHFAYRACLTGTPHNKSVTELWNQVFILDDGKRLGANFFQFRNATQVAVQTGPRPEHVEWRDKDYAEQAVSALLQDISIRHVFEDCVDVPENVERIVRFELSPRHRARYEKLAAEALLILENEVVTAVNAAALMTKLLQCASGAVYIDGGSYARIATERYELITELVRERSDPSIVFFNWEHQRAELCVLARKMEIEHAYIDGSVTQRRRTQIVQDFQAGHLQTLLLHPQAAGHGLTLTRGRTTIWASPVHDPGLFRQGNGRIYRVGQHHKTETLMIAANNTVEEKVFATLNQRGASMKALLGLLAA